jgi:hypothetical protein
VDPAGAVIVAGRFSGLVDPGGGALTGQSLLKLDASGNHVWSKSLGTAEPTAIATDAGGRIVVAGELYGYADLGGGPLLGSGAFVAAFDASGGHLWSTSFGTGRILPTSVVVDGGGRTHVGGDILAHASADFGGGPVTSRGAPLLFLAELDAAGALLRGGAIGCGDHTSYQTRDVLLAQGSGTGAT